MIPRKRAGGRYAAMALRMKARRWQAAGLDGPPKRKEPGRGFARAGGVNGSASMEGRSRAKSR